MHIHTLRALTGLVGAVGNNGKTEDTDAIVRDALLAASDSDWSAQIHAETYRISPGCATCPSPCGNTSDYPLDKLESWSEDHRLLIEQVILEMQRIARKDRPDLPEIVYRAITYIGCDLEDGSYLRLLEDIKQW